MIGLNLFDANSNKNISFLNELKTKSLIGDYCWYFNFDKWNSTNGKLIIGLLPHEMNVSNTSSKILVYANNTKNSNFWEMKFDQIYFMNKTDNNKKVSSNNQTVELNFDSNVIIGTKEYKNKLTLIIKELIDAKTCNSSTILAYDDEFNNLSSNYTFYYCSNDNKMSLKKWEIKLGIHRHEMGIPWEKPVPRNQWEEVADYCANDVISTEAVFNATQDDFMARGILADLADMSVKDTTN